MLYNIKNKPLYKPYSLIESLLRFHFEWRESLDKLTRFKILSAFGRRASDKLLNDDYMRLTSFVASSACNHDISTSMVIGTSAMPTFCGVGGCKS